ncbi:MAG: DUF2170 family protein [Gammaproteobacteria bacterium]|nr:DUF2170 family protein [Gammaproteobacteria bacterium]
MHRLQELTYTLSDLNYEGHTFNCLPIGGAQNVLQILVSDLDEMPIYVTVTDTQMLCITYLCRRDEIRTDKRDELNRSMLEMNVAVPLSSFALIEDYYVIFGALSTTSSINDICRELVTLAANAYDALEAIEEFLV